MCDKFGPQACGGARIFHSSFGGARRSGPIYALRGVAMTQSVATRLGPIAADTHLAPAAPTRARAVEKDPAAIDTGTSADPRPLRPQQQGDRRGRDRTQEPVWGVRRPMPGATVLPGPNLTRSQRCRMGLGNEGETGLARLSASRQPCRRSMDRLAQAKRCGQEPLAYARALGHRRRQSPESGPVEDSGMGRPAQQVLRLAQVFERLRAAAATRRVGEIERCCIADQGQRAGARGRQGGGGIAHLTGKRHYIG